MVSGEDFPNKANQTSRIFPASLPSSLDKGLTIGRADRTNAVLKKNQRNRTYGKVVHHTM